MEKEQGPEFAPTEVIKDRDPKTGKYVENSAKPPEATMTHELQHAWDMANGVTPTIPGMNAKYPNQKIDETENEARAVRTENIYNEATKGKGNIRRDYGGQPVSNPEPENSPLNNKKKK